MVILIGTDDFLGSQVIQVIERYTFRAHHTILRLSSRSMNVFFLLSLLF